MTGAPVLPGALLRLLRGALRPLRAGRGGRNLVRRVVVRDVDVPLHAAELAAEHERVAAARGHRAEVLLQERRLAVEVAAHGLLVGEQKRGARVLDAAGRHAQLRRLAEEHGHRLQELGRPARLQDHLVAVDEQRRLGKDVRVQVRAAAGGDDEALRRRHGVVQNLARQRADAWERRETGRRRQKRRFVSVGMARRVASNAG